MAKKVKTKSDINSTINNELIDNTNNMTIEDINKQIEVNVENDILNDKNLEINEITEVKLELEISEITNELNVFDKSPSLISNNVKVKIKPLSTLFKPFEKANNDKGNACYDVYATSVDITDKYIEYGLGFSCEFDSDYMMIINPRSSVSKYNLIMANSQGIVDSSYRDEVKVRFKVIPNLAVYYMYKEKTNTTKDDKTYSYDEVKSTTELKNAFNKGLLKAVYSSNLQIEDMLIYGYKQPVKYSELNIYNVGDKIAQIYIQKLENTSFEYIDNNQELSKSKRNGGFGSTGK